MFFSELAKATGKIFGMKHCVVDLYQDCSNNGPRVKIGPALGGSLVFIIYI
jgi:hypothetical protein